MSLAQLSEVMGRLGRPIMASGLYKIEMATRRVDVDDLTALAVALDVSPSRLLLTEDGGDGPVELTPAVTVEKDQAWAWVSGECPLDAGPRYERAVLRGAEERRYDEFRHENRPHRPTDKQVLGWMSHRPEVVAALSGAIRVAIDAGVDFTTIQAFAEVINDQWLREATDLIVGRSDTRPTDKER